VPNCPDTSAPVGWCRNVLGPKCPGSEVSWHIDWYDRTCWICGQSMHLTWMHLRTAYVGLGTTGWASSWTSPLNHGTHWLYGLAERPHKIDHTVNQYLWHSFTMHGASGRIGKTPLIWCCCNRPTLNTNIQTGAKCTHILATYNYEVLSRGYSCESQFGETLVFSFILHMTTSETEMNESFRCCKFLKRLENCYRPWLYVKRFARVANFISLHMCKL